MIQWKNTFIALTIHGTVLDISKILSTSAINAAARSHVQTIDHIPKDIRQIHCEICQATFKPIPLDPTRPFQYWQCFCKRQITKAQIRDSFNKAKAVIEQQLPEINIIVLLQGSIRIEGIWIGNDRRSLKRKALTKEYIELIRQEFKQEVCKQLQIRLSKPLI